MSKLSKAHRAQLFNYMRLTKKSVGLLINFGDEQLRGDAMYMTRKKIIVIWWISVCIQLNLRRMNQKRILTRMQWCVTQILNKYLRSI